MPFSGSNIVHLKQNYALNLTKYGHGGYNVAQFN